MVGHIAVLGAGICGRLMAWQLAQLGYQVQLFEANNIDDQHSASFVAAGMLSPLIEASTSESYIGTLGLASMALWPTLISKLPMPVFFQQEGTMVIWHPTDQSEKERFLRQLSQHTPLLSTGADVNTSKTIFCEIDQTLIAQLEPQLANRFHQAIYLPSEGQLDNQALLSALIEGFMASGGRCFWKTPLSLEIARRDIKAQLIVDCRGMGSQSEWISKSGAGSTLHSDPLMNTEAKQSVQALRGVRGELIRVYAPEIKLHRPVRLLHPRYPLYIVPKPDDVYVVGATVIESEDDSPVSVYSAMELLSALYTLHPSFGEARILNMATQCRPTLTDHRPAIRYGEGNNSQCAVLQVNGLSRHGFLLAPIVVKSTIQAIAAILKGTFDTTINRFNWQQQQPFPALFGEET